MMGPNVKRLTVEFMAMIAVPPGSGFSAAVDTLLDNAKLKAVAREAQSQVREALDAVKAAPDNPWGEDDEAIAAEILRKVEERKAERRGGR